MAFKHRCIAALALVLFLVSPSLARAGDLQKIISYSVASTATSTKPIQLSTDKADDFARALNMSRTRTLIALDQQETAPLTSNERNSMNRIAAFPASQAAEQRSEWLDRIVAEVVTHKAPPLNVEERDAAVLLVQSDPDALVRESLWQLLANSPRHESAVALARQVVVDPQSFPRWSAFKYLREVDPQTAENLSQGVLVQPDADLLYVVADFVMLKDLNRGLALMIDVVPMVRDLNLFESLSLALALKGGERQLDELNRRDLQAGGNTAYGTVADMLAAELARKSQSSNRSPM